MKARIGYLVPEFPGQTHTWIWRDVRALAELGVQADLVSTRRPKLIVHAWATEAQAITHYLVPMSGRDVGETAKLLGLAGPKVLARCLRTVLAADATPQQRLRIGALIVIAARFAALARERGWSQLHVLSAGDAALLGLFASFMTGIPYSLTLLAPLEGYGPNQRLKWSQASFGLVMSEKLLAEVRSTLGDAAPARLEIAPMGVDVDQARRAAPYEPWRPGQPCRVYTCGRLHPVKGHRYLLDALALLVARGYPVQLQIAGGEEGGVSGYKASLLGQIGRLGLDGRVELLGAVTEERHRQCIEAAHLFVLASLDEGISVAAMEAMAMQTPAVVTDVGGMRELVSPDDDALMVPSENPQALADAMARILDDPELARRLTERSRHKIEATFHHRRSAEALARCLGLESAPARATSDRLQVGAVRP